MEMIGVTTFSEEQLKRAEQLLGAEGCVKTILFSGGTYQIEIIDGDPEWVFLQMDQEGRVLDSFCTCEEDDKSCVHKLTAQLAVFGKEKDPLHIRFQSSFWHALFQILAKRYGYPAQILEREEKLYAVKEEVPHLFQIVLRDPDLEVKMIEYIDSKKEETEETSLKFSNLSLEEIEAWQKGRPSETLKYELSFWSDLAKMLFLMEDKGEEISIHFDGKKSDLPRYVEIKHKSIEIKAPIEKEDWPSLIPSLSLYETNLKVYDFQDVTIETIVYDPAQAQFVIDSKPIPLSSQSTKKVEWDKWTFQAGVGFFAKQTEPLLQGKVIPKDKMSYFLQKYPRLIEKYLVGTSFVRRPKKALYTLFFDEEDNLHISTYLFESGDLTQKEARFFDPWAYVPNKGFYRLYQTLFKGVEKVISKDDVALFIERNRHWLNRYEGFRIHLSNIETKMTYHMEGDTLKIESDQSFFDETGDLIDFGAWLYVKGQGFFSRTKSSGQKGKLPHEVFKGEISNFIHDNREELEQIPGFFTQDIGLEKAGLQVSLNDEDQIIIEPKYLFQERVEEKGPRIYGDFIYIPTKGFGEIPDNRKIPPAYWKKVVVEKEEVPYFLKGDLKRIKPYILDLDKRLFAPSKLKLVAKRATAHDKGWWIEFALVSNLGEVSLTEVRSALLKFHPMLLSQAGMISLKERRFMWLAKIPALSVDPDTHRIYMSTIDWIRLSLFDEVSLKETDDPEEKKVMETLSHLLGARIGELPKLKGLESVLRPYQEMGVRWLWFLYAYGLSGFLCDEMGLGKTHQAMALIAAVMNEKKKSTRSKFLVVCPTSVIYHWQGLLEKFLKKADVLLYHGPFRDTKALKKKYDIVVTSYGVLRSDKDLFKNMHFEVAIFDEMQVAKNQKSQIHTTLKQISAEMKLALTGTPIENSLTELKALFDIILPQFLPSMQEFKEEFVTPIEKNGDTEKQKILGTLIKPFILRRKKQEVLQDLPEKIEELCFVDLSDEQRRLYESTVMGSKGLLDEEGSSFYVHVFALLTKLKQICNHPALFYQDPKNFQKYESGKWDLFLNLLEETLASGQKIVVFSQYLQMLDIIEEYLKKEGIAYASIRGSTTNRQEEVRRFQEDKECHVFVGSLQAAGVGIDLTAASVVVHYDRWWNPAKENQATDRVHRIGQNRGVSVFKFVVKHSIEEHIDHLIEKKMHLVKNIVGYDSEQDFKKLDRAELEKLLQKIYKDVGS